MLNSKTCNFKKKPHIDIQIDFNCRKNKISVNSYIVPQKKDAPTSWRIFFFSNIRILSEPIYPKYHIHHHLASQGTTIG